MEDLIDVVLLEYKEKQFRLAISEFRGELYLSVREWYMSFEGDFKPTTNGFTIPYNLHSTSALYNGLTAILSRAETLSEVKKSNVEELVKQTRLFALVSKELGITTTDKIEILESDLENRTITLGVNSD